ncbi:transient receptor potential channel pyrexia isoform X2 [Lutzomyia longipalpis]|uniref:transient receptor potential channel pyrexia isoform X2 n=1 Tax=Lutzomyia longipalpis TaxID=7200 RepID=UPI0024837AF6|nr:transient receptor potential channel pyrexia isoform X2 [Lutzomyia longipalpis]
MENLGFKEGTAKPKRLTRGGSSNTSTETAEAETTPLTNQRLKTAAPHLRLKWRNLSLAVIEAQLATPDRCDYMEVGQSPPAEFAPSVYEALEQPSVQITVQICNDTIRENLHEEMKLMNGRLKLFDDVENFVITSENIREHLEGSSKAELNLCFLWATFLRRHDLLEGLLQVGSELNFADSTGISALHLAAFSGCVKCTEFLILHGVDVNFQTGPYTPLHCAAFGNSAETAKILIDSGADLTIHTKKQNNEESLLHCAVRANAVDCVKLFVAQGADVNSIKPSGTNPIHLAAELGLVKCLRVLLNSPEADPNLRIGCGAKESTALHLAADNGNSECLGLLLAKRADAKLKNHRGLTALHLAAKSTSLKCVEQLLRVGGADPNALDFDHRTPLHGAVGKTQSSFKILETLIAWGANVNQQDIYGFTPLHLAALDGLSDCVETLIFHGADVTLKTRKGTTALNIIVRKTPASLKMINHKLDHAITLHTHKVASNREVELELDFGPLLQHCHPREISYLKKIVEENHKEVLQHPICTAFLYLKWKKIRKYYIARLIFCFIHISLFSLYVLTALAHNCYNRTKDMEEASLIQAQELCQKQSMFGDMLRSNPFVIEIQWWVLAAVTLVDIARKLCGISGYSSVKQYLTSFENLIEWFVVGSVFVTSYVYTQRTYFWQNHIGAFAILLGWTNLMLMVGQLPFFGVYVAMYTKVQTEFAKLFMAYFFVLIGFTISFCIIFPDSPYFPNPFVAFIIVLILMTGEIDLSMLTNDPDGKDPPVLLEISAQITFILFLFFITIILMNLLVGVAVNDIEALKESAELSKLVRQTELISYIESALFNEYIPKWLRKFVHESAMVSPHAYRAILCVKPQNPGEKRLPREILDEALEVGKQRKDLDHTLTNKESDESLNSSFKRKGSRRGGRVLERQDSICPSLHRVESTPGHEVTKKMEDNAEKIDILSNEVKELKAILHQNHSTLEHLLFTLTKGHETTRKKSIKKGRITD